VILFVRKTEGIPRNGKSIEDALGKKFEIKVPFVRIG